jgi:hypothetical protein
MKSIKTITTTAAFVLALSGYAFAQGTLGDSGTSGAAHGSAVESSTGAVGTAPSAVESAPSAVETAPSAVESSATGGDLSYGSSSLGSTGSSSSTPSGGSTGATSTTGGREFRR